MCMQGYECGPACSCLPSCSRRTSQQGLSVPVRLRKGTKGWSAVAAANVARGQYVCLYVGEQIPRKVAMECLRGYDAVPGGANHALLVRARPAASTS